MEKKVRVYLYLTPFYPCETDWRGGFCQDFVAALHRVTDYEVVVLVPGRDFPFWQLPCTLAPFFWEKLNNREFVQALKVRGISPKDVAVVHANTMKTALFAAEIKRLNPRSVAILHHHALNSVRETSGRLGRIPIHAALLRRYNRRLCAAVDLHVFVSEAVRRAYPFELRANQRGIVCYNGIAPEFKPISTVCTNHEKDAFTIGCVANFYPLKNQMTLLKAIEKLEEKSDKERWKVVFVGSGPELDRCRLYAAEKKINAEFRGEMPHGEMPQFYNEIDLFVLPSSFDGFGCVCAEAWACGTPFVTTSGTGISELVSEKNRKFCLANPFDSEDLANKISLAKNARVRQSLTQDLAIDGIVKELIAKIEAGR